MSDFDSLDIKQLREQLSNEELPALRDAGLLKPATIDYLESYRETYEPGQAPHHETGEPAHWYYNSTQYVQVVRREVGKALSRAVRDGNLSLIQHSLGLNNNDGVEVDFVDFFKVKELLETPAFMLNIFGAPRTGKTFSAARLVDLWCLLNPNGLVISNINSWAEIHPQGIYTERMPKAIKLSEEHDGPTLLFADELSAEGTHSDIQKSGVEAGIRSFFRKMGKDPYDCSYIGIGHRVVEVAPMLRSGELAYFGFKEGRTKEAAQKHLVIYEDSDKEDVVCDLGGIGLPEYSPDTHDPATWDWGTPDEYIELGHMKPDDDGEDGSSDGDGVDADKAALRAKEDLFLEMNENDMGVRKIAKETGIPRSTVGDMITRARDRDESSE